MTQTDEPLQPTEPTPAAEPEAPRPLAPQPIRARAGTYYRNARYLMTLLAVGMGVAFLFDGYYRYPKHNREYEQARARRDELAKVPEADRTEAQKADYAAANARVNEGGTHSESDLTTQKRVGYALIPLGFAFLGFVLWKSRGHIRLEDDVLHAPGHPPVPLASITEIDDAKWDRKGVADLKYALADGRAGTVRLDDFVYQREPVDQIFDHVVAYGEVETGNEK